MPGLIVELRRRSVFRVAAAYLALAWLLLQVIDTVIGLVGLPDWVGPFSLVALGIGFPVAIGLAWYYELTPEGIQTADDVEIEKPVPGFGGRRIDFVIIGALSLVIVMLVTKDLIVPPSQPDATAIPTVHSYTQITRSPVVFPPYESPYPLVADDSRLYFNDFLSGVIRVRQLAQTGGEAVPFDVDLDDPGMALIPTSMTPDNSGILMSWFDDRMGAWKLELMVVPVVGGTPRTLGEGYGAVYSPDGNSIAYAAYGSGLFIANPDLTEPRLLFESEGEINGIDFSPDSEWIRFGNWERRRTIMEINVDGGEARSLLPDWERIEHCCGNWTPDGEYYVFQATHQQSTQLWAVRNSDGRVSDPQQITAGPLNFRRPTIAPDGRRIFAIGWQLRGEIVRYNAAVQQFTPMSGFDRVSAELLQFSRDGSKVSFLTYPERNLWRSNSDGSDRTQLTFDPMQSREGIWSPDGRTIAFTGELPDRSMQIYLVPSDGGVPEPMTPEDTLEFSPTWSPDSSAIAFSQYGSDEILLYDVATRSVSPMAGTENLYYPDWSPDGQTIAAWTKNRGVALFDVETGDRRELLGPDAQIQSFFWASDSRHIYYVDNLMIDRDGSLHRIRIADGATETIASLGGVLAPMGRRNIWVGVDPEGAPMMLRDLSIHNVYELSWRDGATSD